MMNAMKIHFWWYGYICVCLYVWYVPAGPNLKVVSTMSVGYDHLSLDELKKRWFLALYFFKYIDVCVITRTTLSSYQCV